MRNRQGACLALALGLALPGVSLAQDPGATGAGTTTSDGQSTTKPGGEGVTGTDWRQPDNADEQRKKDGQVIGADDGTMRDAPSAIPEEHKAKKRWWQFWKRGETEDNEDARLREERRRTEELRRQEQSKQGVGVPPQQP
ncbi:MAG: hypothetical protein HYZ75_14960 [Elusimicrobia bacterium]|nr:hypothetical protein [Elusimicrobiota bacterium]